MIKSNAIKDYDIWGNPSLTVETTENAIRYSGEFYDSETGLYYLRARYYDPYIGRFTTEDSYWGEDKNPLSLNLYTYCENDPINSIDPTGHAAKKGNEAYLTALASAAGGTVKWDSKNKVAVVNVNGIEKKLKTGDYKNVNGKIVIDNNEFDKLFTDTSKRTYTNTSVSNKTISATTLRFDSGYDKQPTVKSGTSVNTLGAKQSPKPKDNEKYKVLQNEKKNGAESNNRNDTAVTQVTLDALGFMDMPLRKNGETIDYGYFGSVTEDGVINFQSQYYRNKAPSEVIKHLANGKVDITTWKALGLPVDKKGQPDRNSYAYKELLKVAKEHKTINYDDLNKILTGSSGFGVNSKSTGTKQLGVGDFRKAERESDSVLDGIMTSEEAEEYMYSSGGLFTKYYSSDAIKNIPKSISYMEDGKVIVYNLTKQVESFNGIPYSGVEIKLNDGTVIGTVRYSYEYTGKYSISKSKNGDTVLMQEQENEMSYGVMPIVPGGPAFGMGMSSTTINTLKTSELNTTQGLTMSKNQFKSFVETIKTEGIKEPIKYVEYNGQKYVVDGHHRLQAAKQLGIKDVRVEKVELPYKGYKTVEDLFWGD